MWQRVQTIFLLILGALMLVTVFMDCWQEQQGNQVTTLNAFELEHVKQQAEVSSKPVFYIAGLAILSSLIAFYSISRFKNRLLQIKLGALNSLLMAGVLGLIMLISQTGRRQIIPGVQNGQVPARHVPPNGGNDFNLIANDSSAATKHPACVRQTGCANDHDFPD
jgi:glucan phosphoethanolaminetransferase (alkaline phosphatase superfamily)